MHVKMQHLQVKLQLGSKGNAFPGDLSKADVPQKVADVYETGLDILQAEFCRLPEGKWIKVTCFWGFRFCYSALLVYTPSEESGLLPGHNRLLTRILSGRCHTVTASN